ncbi:hypothetical protein EYR41_009100 [Orbilia oligospora]|uniref:Uncharacterized protein n=1 Tax=Orbilia oligospora TaxID=2813651 RepID=A0A7C8P8J4_ORBOL|nr:hypothetical protein TWF751_000558 [Orbilia oligospora]KAF3248217.1 hypothetical protein TWF217_009188 [Orbilia oligospora]TGJ65101.1 hypothetical protein EYR41_009100 [Orbilia oligospora]
MFLVYVPLASSSGPTRTTRLLFFMLLVLCPQLSQCPESRPHPNIDLSFCEAKEEWSSFCLTECAYCVVCTTAAAFPNGWPASLREVPARQSPDEGILDCYLQMEAWSCDPIRDTPSKLIKWGSKKIISHAAYQ